MMQIAPIPALLDNYIFLLYDLEQKIAAVVDPALAEPVLQTLQELGLPDLVAIFNTHHHSDHVGANRQLLKHFPRLCIYGGIEDRGRIPGQHIFLREGDRIQFTAREGQVLFVPGHTRAHIAYYFPPSQKGERGEMFCGDTLFSGGCGRLLEGTPTQMMHSLAKIRALPDDTRIWCAHEYTANNLKFALTVDPDNAQLQARLSEVLTIRRQDKATIPSWLGLEKLINPFLRWDQPALQQTAQSQDSVQVFTYLRCLKDRF